MLLVSLLCAGVGRSAMTLNCGFVGLSMNGIEARLRLPPEHQIALSSITNLKHLNQKDLNYQLRRICQ
jgi:hypothetical protein